MFPSVIVLLFANCFLVSFGTPTFDPSVPITSRDIQLRVSTITAMAIEYKTKIFNFCIVLQ